MNPNRRLPSLEFLMECSQQSLTELELRSLDSSAQCLKRAKMEWEESIVQREAAGVVRFFIENRELILEQARKTVEAKVPVVFPSQQKKTA